MGLRSPFQFQEFSRRHFKTNKLQKVTIVKFRPLPLIFFFRLIINMSHLFKLRHRKKVLESFRKFISQERHIGILIWTARWLYFNLHFKWNITVLSFKIWNPDSLGVKNKTEDNKKSLQNVWHLSCLPDSFLFRKVALKLYFGPSWIHLWNFYTNIL